MIIQEELNNAILCSKMLLPKIKSNVTCLHFGLDLMAVRFTQLCYSYFVEGFKNKN